MPAPSLPVAFHDPTPLAPREVSFFARLSARTHSEAQSPNAMVFGGYRLERALSRGAFATVWLGRELGSERPVALKILRTAECQSATSRVLLRAEAEVLRRLDHPRIPRLLDDGVVPSARGGGRPFLATELAGPWNLAQLLRTSRTWRFSVVKGLLEQLLGTLGHVHQSGFIHRDIKPANLMVDREHGSSPRLTLVDFGSAMSTTGTAPRVASVGSPSTMAPELIRGDWRAQGPWTDLYAVGCVAHRLLTGTPAFRRSSREAMLKAHLEEAPDWANPGEDAPEGIDLWVRKLLSKRPAARYESAAEARRALRAIIA